MKSAESMAALLLRPEVLALSAYHVQDFQGLVKLDAMENPYHWPAEMIDEWLEDLRSVEVNRYPDASASRLKSALRTANSFPDGMEVMLGNGSDELIQIILMAVAGGCATVLAPNPTFVMYRQSALSLGLRYVGVDLNRRDFSLDMSAMRTAIARHSPKVVFIAQPNNPTGNAFALEDLLEIVRIAPGLVVVDEAYAPFAQVTLMPYLLEFPNLLVMRTLSKQGLAGLRLGYLVGCPEWINQLDKLRLPYNINVLTQVTACFALSKLEILDDQVARIRRDRESLYSRLSELPVQVFQSQANFLTFRVSKNLADEVFLGLKKAGILIKNLSPTGDLLTGCLRVTVGTPEENQRLVDALSVILSA